MNKLSPPVCKKKEHTLSIHGSQRTDLYYWLNAYWKKGIDSEEVLNYLKEENEYATTCMKQDICDTIYKEIKSRIKEDDESVPYFHNGYWYITRYELSKEYPIYERKATSLEAPSETLIDVNELAANKPYCQFASFVVSPDNKKLIYGVDFQGRRQYELYVVDIRTEKILQSPIKQTEGYAVWANDNSTFFYIANHPTTLRGEKVLRHIVGEEKAEEVYTENDAAFNLGVAKSRDDKLIFIEASSITQSEVHYISAYLPQDEFSLLYARSKDHLYNVDCYHDFFYIHTNRDADNFKLVRVAIHSPSWENWKEVVAHREDVLLEDIELFQHYLVLEERRNALVQIRVISWDGKNDYYLTCEDNVYVCGIGYNPEPQSNFVRYTFESMRTPRKVIDHKIGSDVYEQRKQLEVPKHSAADYHVDRIWCKARDGVSVPMSIIYHKEKFQKDGSHPLLLYGYGSYGYSIDPTFSISRLSLLQRGFAFCIAHVRGGAEMGRSWYKEGKMQHKKNTFTDFIDCAENLIQNNYTSSNHLYAQGGSAGGLLMGVIANERPELWNGVIAEVPFVDVLTTMSDPSIPLTVGEYEEWGNPHSRKEYEYMASYSPYDNVRLQAYPHMLVSTGLHDSQVQYFEPAKWVAKLRAHKANDALLLFFTDMDTGHSGSSGRFKVIKEIARHFGFILTLENMT